MKNSIITVVGFLVGFSLAAWAAEPPDALCTVTTSTSTASSTILSADGGTCTWTAGSNLLMRCTTDVYFSAAGHLPVGNIQSDGGWYYDGGITGTVATSNSNFADFTNNKDPIPLYLDAPNDKHVSLLAATSAGLCKFSLTKRPKPQAK